MKTVQTIIKIGGRLTSLPQANFIQISSTMHGHHHFIIKILLSDFDQFELADLKRIKGQNIEINYLGEYGLSGSGVFHGLIDKVKIDYSQKGEAPHLSIIGFSKTVHMDYAPTFRCFSETTLEAIIRKVLNENGHLFPKVNIDIQTAETVKWAMQLNESDFDFLKRKISESATLEMWYDGACLHIANITNQNEAAIPLEHGVDLDHPEISLDVSPLEFTVKAYDFVNGRTQEASATKLVSANPLISLAINNSPYPKKEIFLPYGFDETINLNRVVRKMAGQQAHTLYNITADSSQPNLKVGSAITIQMKENFFEREIENETFVITAITHTIDAEGIYENTFHAVPKSIPYNLALEASSKPTCGPRAAIVVDNKDPKKMGRCKVMFIGDPNRATSPWLRCLTTSTSHNGVVGIPKRKEQVLIFSESLNPERSAFIMGSFWFKNQDASKCDAPESIMGWYFKNGGFWYDERDGSFNINARKIKMIGSKVIIEGTEQGTFINCGEE